MDCSLPGSSVHGIFQARVLEWGAIAYPWSTSQFPPQSVTPIRKVFILIHQRAIRMKNHNHRKLIKLIVWMTALSNSIKLWAKPWPLDRATQDRWVMVESSDKMWSTGKGNGKSLQHSCLENPMNSVKRQKDRTLKDELPRSVGAQYATGDQWRNNSRKNEETESKQKQHPVVDVTDNGNKVWCCKEQYCTGTWNVRSMNQGKLEVVKQKMARVNLDILGISELKWMEMVNLIQITIISTTAGRNPLEEMK